MPLELRKLFFICYCAGSCLNFSSFFKKIKINKIIIYSGLSFSYVKDYKNPVLNLNIESIIKQLLINKYAPNDGIMPIKQYDSNIIKSNELLLFLQKYIPKQYYDANGQLIMFSQDLINRQKVIKLEGEAIKEGYHILWSKERKPIIHSNGYFYYFMIPGYEDAFFHLGTNIFCLSRDIKTQVSVQTNVKNKNEFFDKITELKPHLNKNLSQKESQDIWSQTAITKDELKKLNIENIDDHIKWKNTILATIANQMISNIFDTDSNISQNNNTVNFKLKDIPDYNEFFKLWSEKKDAREKILQNQNRNNRYIYGEFGYVIREKEIEDYDHGKEILEKSKDIYKCFQTDSIKSKSFFICVHIESNLEFYGKPVEFSVIFQNMSYKRENIDKFCGTKEKIGIIYRIYSFIHRNFIKTQYFNFGIGTGFTFGNDDLTTLHRQFTKQQFDKINDALLQDSKRTLSSLIKEFLLPKKNLSWRSFLFAQPIVVVNFTFHFPIIISFQIIININDALQKTLNITVLSGIGIKVFQKKVQSEYNQLVRQRQAENNNYMEALLEGV